MGVILKNKSKYPTRILQVLWDAAYKVSGCRRDVIVKMGYGSNRGVYGLCYSSQYLVEYGRKYSTHGLITLSLPNQLGFLDDPLDWAIKVFKIMLHEFHHCREYQDRFDFGAKILMDHDLYQNGVRTRRMRHKDRPQEHRARAAEEVYYEEVQAFSNWNEIEECILSLGLLLEKS